MTDRGARRQGGIDPQNYTPTAEEKVVLDEIRSAFLTRGLVGGFGFVFIGRQGERLQYNATISDTPPPARTLNQPQPHAVLKLAGRLPPRPKMWLVGYYALSGGAGMVLGASTYQSTAQRKILALRNSPLADDLRHKLGIAGGGGGGAGGSGGGGVGAGGSGQHSEFDDERLDDGAFAQDEFAHRKEEAAAAKGRAGMGVRGGVGAHKMPGWFHFG